MVEERNRYGKEGRLRQGSQQNIRKEETCSEAVDRWMDRYTDGRKKRCTLMLAIGFDQREIDVVEGIHPKEDPQSRILRDLVCLAYLHG